MSKQTHWIIPTLLALLVLAGCRADEFDEEALTEVFGDTIVTIENEDHGDGEMVLYAAGDEELSEVNRVSMDHADKLFSDVTIPNPAVVEAQWKDAPNHGSIVTGMAEGDTLAMWHLPHVGYLLGERDGWAQLNATRTDALNKAVGDSLAPGVDNLHAATGYLDEDPESRSLGVNDPDLITLYRMALESLVMSDSTQAEDELEAFLNDAGSGVLDGRGRNGYLLDLVQYNPLKFNPLYKMELSGFAREFGNDELIRTITDDGDTEGVEPRRFVSSDGRCDDQFVSNYFRANAQADIKLDAVEVNGQYGDFLEQGVTYTFAIDEDGTVTVKDSNGDTVTDGNDDPLTVARPELFTCSQQAFDGSQDQSLVRYVSDSLSSAAPEQREELVMVGSGDQALAGEGEGGGVYIATESGDQLAVFGDVDPYRGYEPPKEDSVSSACGLDGYYYFAREAENVTATTETPDLGASIDNEELFVDGEAGTAASITIDLSLLGSGTADLTATADEAPMGDLENVLVLVSRADDESLSVSALDGVTITTYKDGEVQTVYEEGTFLDADLAGTLSNDNLEVIKFSTTKAFDTLEFSVDGNLELDTGIEVHEACYGAGTTN
ncbi:hypothetical protein DES49_0849 [Halospina denitrificans]|uniref:Lipoprotein n=1 Tax=Halospina denitrificans TaxID=332522 RepID=A0A4R7JZP5_9GAMM|nr:hypothetical protein [Halospina denitrificans]TDT43043.1 hypothetical protein DES49_0849 [Halospina denitrificans]